MANPFYPEIDNAGGLSHALDIAFRNIESTLRVSNDETLRSFPLTYARIEKDNKFSQVYISAESKLYLPDFWRDGVCLGHGQTDSIDLLAKCIDYWLTTKKSTAQLAEQFQFITPSKNAIIFDEGKEVEYKWNSILNDPDRKEIKGFVELAIKDEVLSKLFPYTSLMTLCFSRCTGYPYTRDTPTVSPIIETEEYLVRKNNGEVIGYGSAHEALKFVRDNLPKGISAAIRGTSEDI
jgi:hypothetical protein